MKRFEVSKSLFGGLHASYACPNCQERLRSSLKDAGKTDTCPNCHKPFIVPGTNELREEIQRKTDEKLHKQLKARRKAEETERKKQEKREHQNAIIEARRTADEEAKRQREREIEPIQNESEPDTPIAPKNSSRQWFIYLVVAALAFAVVSIVYAISTKSGAGVTDIVQSAGLRNKLKSCPSYGVVMADAYYDGTISTDVVVFDLLDGGSSTARRIDPIHLFFQFSDKLDLYSVRKVVLARNGTKKFTIASSDLRPLAESYANDGRPWAFNHLPESVRTMSGARAYGEWSGGLLGVLQKQTEDLNDFIEAWAGY